MKQNKYFAFISYSRDDKAVAEWLQRALENFRYPRDIVPADKRPEHPKYVRRIFVDQNELEVSSVDFRLDIERSLRASRYFILLCSPSSAVSPWVRNELEYFLKTHSNDTSLVLPVIIAGGTIEEIFSGYFEPYRKIFAVRNLPDLRTSGGHKHLAETRAGLAKILAYLLGIPYGAINNRFKADDSRRVRRMSMLIALSIIGVLVAFSSLFLVNNRAREKSRREMNAMLEAKSKLVNEVDIILTREFRSAPVQNKSTKKTASKTKTINHKETQQANLALTNARQIFEYATAPSSREFGSQTPRSLAERLRKSVIEEGGVLKLNALPNLYPRGRRSRFMYNYSDCRIAFTAPVDRLYTLAYLEPSAFVEIGSSLKRSLDVLREDFLKTDAVTRANAIAKISKTRQTELEDAIFQRLRVAKLRLEKPTPELIAECLRKGELCFVSGFSGVEFNLIESYDEKNGVFFLRDISSSDGYSSFGTSVLHLPDVKVFVYKTELSDEQLAQSSAEQKVLEHSQNAQQSTNFSQQTQKVISNSDALAREKNTPDGKKKEEYKESFSSLNLSSSPDDFLNNLSLENVTKTVRALRAIAKAEREDISEEAIISICLSSPNLTPEKVLQSWRKTVLDEIVFARKIMGENSFKRVRTMFSPARAAGLIKQGAVIFIPPIGEDYAKWFLARSRARRDCADNNTLLKNLSQIKINTRLAPSAKERSCIILGHNKATSEFAVLDTSAEIAELMWITSAELSNIIGSASCAYVERVAQEKGK